MDSRVNRPQVGAPVVEERPDGGELGDAQQIGVLDVVGGRDAQEHVELAEDADEGEALRHLRDEAIDQGVAAHLNGRVARIVVTGTDGESRPQGDRRQDPTQSGRPRGACPGAQERDQREHRGDERQHEESQPRGETQLVLRLVEADRERRSPRRASPRRHPRMAPDPRPRRRSPRRATGAPDTCSGCTSMASRSRRRTPYSRAE